MITVMIGGSASSWPVVIVVPLWFMGMSAGIIAAALIIGGVVAGTRWLTTVGLTLGMLNLAVTAIAEKYCDLAAANRRRDEAKAAAAAYEKTLGEARARSQQLATETRNAVKLEQTTSAVRWNWS